MPIAVVKFTQNRLHEQPDKWEVEHIFLGKPQQQIAVRINSAEASVWFLRTPQSWCLLTEQSLPCLNEILGHNLNRHNLYNEKELHDYLHALDYMMIGQGWNMDEEFIRRECTPKYARRLWLNGRVKSSKALRRLCHHPMVSVQGDQVIITYNRVTYGGSVLRRTVRARLSKWLEITGLEKSEILPEGTFSYPYLGGG